MSEFFFLPEKGQWQNNPPCFMMTQIGKKIKLQNSAKKTPVVQITFFQIHRKGFFKALHMLSINDLWSVNKCSVLSVILNKIWAHFTLMYILQTF